MLRFPLTSEGTGEAFYRQLVVERHRVEDGLQVVVAVRTAFCDVQAEVYLAAGLYGVGFVHARWFIRVLCLQNYTKFARYGGEPVDFMPIRDKIMGFSIIAASGRTSSSTQKEMSDCKRQSSFAYNLIIGILARIA